MREGWKCPVCGAGVAPHVARCDHGDDLGGSLAHALPPSPVTPGVVTINLSAGSVVSADWTEGVAAISRLVGHGLKLTDAQTIVRSGFDGVAWSATG